MLIPFLRKYYLKKPHIPDNLHLSRHDSLDVDGTTLQADANIYSFTWKKTADRYEANLNKKMVDLYKKTCVPEVDVTLTG